jgi:hypothetical protein
MPFHAITLADGTLAIMQTIGAADPAACIAKWPAEMQQAVIAHAPLDPATIPSDRTFRDAWTLQSGAVVHDMAKARDIWRERLRAERAPLLTALDQAYLKADEAGDAAGKAAIAAQKQQLRAAPADPSIDAAETPDDLKAITLTALAPQAAAAASTAEVAADPDPVTVNPAPQPEPVTVGTPSVDRPASSPGPGAA